MELHHAKISSQRKPFQRCIDHSTTYVYRIVKDEDGERRPVPASCSRLRKSARMKLQNTSKLSRTSGGGGDGCSLLLLTGMQVPPPGAVSTYHASLLRKSMDTYPPCFLTYHHQQQHESHDLPINTRGKIPKYSNATSHNYHFTHFISTALHSRSPTIANLVASSLLVFVASSATPHDSNAVHGISFILDAISVSDATCSLRVTGKT